MIVKEKHSEDINWFWFP